MTIARRFPFTCPAEVSNTRAKLSSRRAAGGRSARQSERFSAFVAASSDVVYQMNSDWTEMRRLVGKDFIPDTSAPSRDWLTRYIPPDDQAKVRETIAEAIRQKKMFALEHRVFQVDGTLGWTFSRAIPIRGRRGEIREWFGAASDITARKRAEEALHDVVKRLGRQHRFYDTILSSTTDLIYVFDLNHRFAYANAALLKMWGRTADDALGKNCLELGYEPWHAAMHDREIDQVIATRQPIIGEVPFSGTYGRRIYEYIFVPVLGEAGEVEMVAGVTRDVTDRRAAEDRLRESEERLRVANTLLADRASHLEAVVEQRTARLREANSDLETFSYSIAHDLRAPLRSLQGYSELLLQDYGPAMPDDAQRMLQRMSTAAARMDRLISEVLSFSRLAREECRLGHIDLDALIDDIVATYPSLAPETLQVQRAGPLGAVQANEAMVTQIVSNLLTNAVKFARPDAKPRVEIRADRSNSHVRLSFQDNGIGIPADQQEKIWGLFQKLDTSSGGTGVGLAVVKKAADRMGGSVGVTSEPGRGSTFWVDLPAPAGAH